MRKIFQKHSNKEKEVEDTARPQMMHRLEAHDQTVQMEIEEEELPIVTTPQRMHMETEEGARLATATAHSPNDSDWPHIISQPNNKKDVQT